MQQKKLAAMATESKPNYRGPLVLGLIVISLFFGGFGTWANIAKMDTAAVANGQITVDSNRKTIQHLEGGIVKKLFVREGAVVKAGDPLIKLDETKARAQRQALQAELDALEVTASRLVAERDQHASIHFPDRLIAQMSHNADIKAMITGQRALFKANKRNLNSTINILKQRIEQFKAELTSINSQVTSYKKQLVLINHEINVTLPLVKKKFIAQNHLWALRREAARLEGQLNQRIGQVAKIKQGIGETELQIIHFKQQHEQQVLTELRKTQEDIAVTKEQLIAATDKLNRTLITAPKAGTVVDLKAHTIGGVITAGEPILDIIPIDDQLVIEAKINPTDIDMIHVGLPTKVQLLAYNMRNTPLLEGTLTHVSADVFNDQQTNSSFYKARVTIAPEQLKKLENVALYPGMPTSVMIVTEKRTFADYLITPLMNSLQRAFKEQ